jgi:hypothetical protein
VHAAHASRLRTKKPGAIWPGRDAYFWMMFKTYKIR